MLDAQAINQFRNQQIQIIRPIIGPDTQSGQSGIERRLHQIRGCSAGTARTSKNQILRLQGAKKRTRTIARGKNLQSSNHARRQCDGVAPPQNDN